MSELFGAGSEDLDWTSDLGVSKIFHSFCCAKLVLLANNLVKQYEIIKQLNSALSHFRSPL